MSEQLKAVFDAELEKVKSDLEKAKYRRQIKRKITSGALPRYYFAKGPDGRLERSAPKPGYPRGKLTWRTKSTLKELSK